jgi:hypothetical protein
MRFACRERGTARRPERQGGAQRSRDSAKARHRPPEAREDAMLFWIFLFIFLVALLVAVIPVWPYSTRWGYAPTVGALVVLLAFLLLVYVGYMGPWTQAGPPYAHGPGDPEVIEEGPDPGAEGQPRVD